jgi:hypothetical protein
MSEITHKDILGVTIQDNDYVCFLNGTVLLIGQVEKVCEKLIRINYDSGNCIHNTTKKGPQLMVVSEDHLERFKKNSGYFK